MPAFIRSAPFLVIAASILPFASVFADIKPTPDPAEAMARLEARGIDQASIEKRFERAQERVRERQHEETELQARWADAVPETPAAKRSSASRKDADSVAADESGQPKGAAPANDDCANAQIIGYGTFTADTTGAGRDGATGCDAGDGSPDLWYRFVAVEDGPVSFDTAGSDFDTVLSVHDDCPGNTANELICQDDFGSPQAAAVVELLAGEEALIRIGGYFVDSVGQVQLHVQPAALINTSVTARATGADLTLGADFFVRAEQSFWTGIPTDSGTRPTGQIALPPGNYRFAAGASGFVTQMFLDTPCPNLFCSPEAGTRVDLLPGEERGGVDFALDQAGQVSGTVTGADTGQAPPDFTFATVFDSTGIRVGSFSTDPAGDYLIVDLPEGTYTASAQSNGYLPQLYDGITCRFGCDPLAGTPFTVSAGATTTGIDFSLAAAGTLAVTVTDASSGLPLPSVSVNLFSSETGTRISGARTDQTGTARFNNLPDGDYLAHTGSTSGYNDELYDDMPCDPNCDPLNGTPIAVVGGQETAIEMALTPFGTLGGQVVDADTGLPIAGIAVEIRSLAGRADVITDAGGMFVSQPLPDGLYRLRTRSNLGYIDEIFADVPCATNCVLFEGEAVQVAAGRQTTADFALTPGAAIGGTVVDAETGAGLAGVEIRALDFNNATLVKQATTDGSGAYLLDGMPAGRYFIETRSGGGFIDERHEDVACLLTGCLPTQGSPIVVSGTTRTTGIDFALSPGGTIEGRLTDNAGAPVSGYRVFLYTTARERSVTSVFSGADGRYAFSGLPADTYLVGTDGPLMDQVYDNVVCSAKFSGIVCDTGQATPIALQPPDTASGIDFQLDPGFSIRGRITDAETGEPAPQIDVHVFSGTTFVAFGSTDGNGDYVVEGLAPGSYFVATSSELIPLFRAFGAPLRSHIDQVFGGGVCVQALCDVTVGTPVLVGPGSRGSDNVDFALDRGGRITGKMINTAGERIPDLVLILDTDDNLIGIFPDLAWYIGSPIGDGYETPGLPPGSYRVETFNQSGYIDKLYDDLPCFRPFFCDTSAGALVAVNGTDETAGIDFVLGERRRNLRMSLTGDGSGRVLSSGDAGLDCDGACIGRYATGQQAVMQALPDAGSVFVDFSGDPDCGDGTLTMTSDKQCIARFDLEVENGPVLPVPVMGWPGLMILALLLLVIANRQKLVTCIAPRR